MKSRRLNIFGPFKNLFQISHSVQSLLLCLREPDNLYSTQNNYNRLRFDINNLALIE
jgi:hypothetical protein